MDTESITNLPDNSNYGRDKIDLDALQALYLANPKLSNRQAAKLIGVSHVSIWHAKHKLEGLDTEVVDKYREIRADIFAEGQRKLIDHWLTSDRVKGMQAKDAALWFNSLFNNEQLLRGQPTSINVNIYTDMVAAIREARGR